MLLKISFVMRFYSIFLLMLLAGCNSDNSTELSNSSLAEDNTILKYPIDIQKEADKLPKEANTNSSDWINLISNHKLGLLSIGDSVTHALSLLDNYFKVIYDSIPYCIGCSEEAEYYYKVLDDSMDLLFTVHPGQNLEDKDYIHAFVSFNPLYRTEKGIGVGNTVLDIKSVYTVSRIVYNYECGLFLFVRGFDGSFGLDFELNDGKKDLMVDEIPEDVIINQIAIY